MSEYVNPGDIVNPDSEDLSEKEVEEVLMDSYRAGRHFIKSHNYPVYKQKENGEVAEDNDAQTPWCIISEMFLKHPIAIDGDENRRLYGYRTVIPGMYRDEDEARTVATKIFKSHNTYSKLMAVPTGSPQPIITWEVTNMEREMERTYIEEIEKNQAEEDNYVIQQRKAEERAREVQNNKFVEGDLDDFVKQQLRIHSAEKRLKIAQETIEDCKRVAKEAQEKVDKMLKEHPEYDDQALPHYQKTMMEYGFDKPESFYDQNEYERQGDVSDMLHTEIKN